MRRRVVIAWVAAAASAAAGCGDHERQEPDYRLVTPPPYVGAAAISTPPPGPERRMTARDARALRPVIEAWAAAVRAGDPAEATRHFKLPAIVFQPSLGAVEVRTRATADAFHAALPCAAELVAARAAGRYVVATFRLRMRPGRVCTTPGDTVRVGFVFGDRRYPRRFTEWWQASGPDVPAGPDERPVAPVAGPAAFG